MNYFRTYSNYRIDVINPELTFALIIGVLLFFVFITGKRYKGVFFDVNSTNSLKGIAVLMLIMGHLYGKCLQSKMVIRMGGYWAVIIFLFLSGYGLYQSYTLGSIKKPFWKKRMLKLYVPLWITLILFIILDFWLINLHHSLAELTLNFIGIHLNGSLIRVNSVAWFIEYVMVLYALYWGIAKVRINEGGKILLLYAACILLTLFIAITPVKRFHSLWMYYTLVFPTGVFFSKYKDKVFSILSRYGFLLLLSIGISLLVFSQWTTWVVVRGAIYFQPLPLICAVIMVLILYEKLNYQSRFLLFLGKYSFEIYLLHAPLMIKYDFILFRKPLYLSFFVYLIALILLAYGLAKLSCRIRGALQRIHI